MAADSRELTALLSRFFADGLPQDRATLAVLAEVLGEEDPRRALALLAAEPDSAEHTPLTALLFSPGPELLRRLEPALATAGLDAAGAAELATAVAADCAGTVPLLLPEDQSGGPPAAFPASVEDVRGFVRRLRAEATAPAELRAILARRFPAELAVRLAVQLRHSRLAWTPPQVFFLAALLERADRNGDELPALVGGATAFLDLCGPEFSPRAALTHRRQALDTQLRQAEAAEKALAGGSFEVRLSQGLRLGHVHAPDVRAELALLDRACLLVLGIAGESLAGEGGVSVRDLGTARDVEEWLGLLP